MKDHWQRNFSLKRFKYLQIVSQCNKTENYWHTVFDSHIKTYLNTETTNLPIPAPTRTLRRANKQNIFTNDDVTPAIDITPIDNINEILRPKLSDIMPKIIAPQNQPK